MNTEIENQTDSTAKDNQPDWVVKSPRGSRLQHIGVAWNREDGGIGIRLSGKQLVDEDIYLYPKE